MTTMKPSCMALSKLLPRWVFRHYKSYQSAQIFEAIGISKEVIDQYFTNTVSRVGGIGLKEIEEDLIVHHDHGFDPLGLSSDTKLDSYGFHKLRSGKGKEDHLYDPQTIITLQKATRENDYELFKAYTKRVNDKDRPHTLRASLEFKPNQKAIPLEEVEPVYLKS